MRRKEISAGIKNIVGALETSGLRELISSRRERAEKAADAVQFLRAFRAYSQIAAGFGPAEKALVQILDLEVLDDPSVWARAAIDTTDVLRELTFRLRFIGQQLDLFLKLLETDAEKIAERPSRATIERISEAAVLTTIVIEEEGHYSAPDRLIKVLRSVSLLYEVVAKIKQANPSTLSVIGCDSGSDKSFDFLGLASVVSGIKEILIAVWDRVVFYREKQIEARLDLISRSLPIIESISALEEQKVIGPEQAEILRRRVTEGVTLFIEAGVLIPEINQHSAHAPRQLLAPEPKLLVSATAPDAQPNKEPNKEEGFNPAESDNLSFEEQELLKKLLDKARKEDAL